MGAINQSDVDKLTAVSDAVGQQIENTVLFVNSQITALVAELTNIVPFFSPFVPFDNKNIMKKIAIDPLPTISGTGDQFISTGAITEPTGLNDESALSEATTPGDITPVEQSVEFPSAPALNVDIGAITFPDAPILSNEGNLPVAPAVSFPVAPTAPESADLPEVPEFLAPVIPPIPSLSFPAFGESLPAFDLTLPVFSFNFVEQPYISGLLDATTVKLLNDVANGGTGLGAIVEQEIYDRADERDARNLVTETTRLRNTLSVSGFELPHSALIASIDNLISEHNDKKADLSREIVIEQANLAQNNTQFAVQQSVQLEGININFHNQVGERALQFARATSDFQIAVVQQEVAFFNAKLQRYTEAANVHFQLLNNELLKIEQYKAQLLGVEAEIAADNFQLQIFQKKVDKLIAEINLFNAEVEAFKSQVDSQRTVIDLYVSQISGFNAQVEFDKNKLELHNLELKTSTVEFDKARAQVDVHNANLQGIRTNSENKQTELNALLDHQKNRISAAQLEISKYEALSGRVTQKEGTLNSKFQNKISANNSVTDAEEKALRGLQENVRIKLDNAVKDMDRIVTLTKLAIDKNFREFDFREKTMQSTVAARQFILEAGAKSEDITSQIT